MGSVRCTVSCIYSTVNHSDDALLMNTHLLYSSGVTVHMIVYKVA